MFQRGIFEHDSEGGVTPVTPTMQLAMRPLEDLLAVGGDRNIGPNYTLPDGRRRGGKNRSGAQARKRRSAEALEAAWQHEHRERFAVPEGSSEDTYRSMICRMRTQIFHLEVCTIPDFEKTTFDLRGMYATKNEQLIEANLQIEKLQKEVEIMAF